MSDLEDLIKNAPTIEIPRIYIPTEDMHAIPQQMLQKYGLLPDSPAPIDIDALAEKVAKVEYRFDLPPDKEGMTLFMPQGIPQIFLSAILEADKTVCSARRFRFLTAHEVAHALIHDPLFKDACLQKSVSSYGYAFYHGYPSFCFLDGVKDYSRYEWIEYQANAIGAGLLMPRCHFLSVYEQIKEMAQYQRYLGNKYEKVRAELPGEFENLVQNTFNVSKSVAHIEVRDFLKGKNEELERLLR